MLVKGVLPREEELMRRGLWVDGRGRVFWGKALKLETVSVFEK